MKKLHLDLAATNYIPDAYRCSAEELAQISGANLGNLVFRHALRSLIEDFDEYEPVTYPQVNSLVGEGKIDSVLVSCANWLGTREQDEKSNKVRADIITRIDAPVVSFGLGVQAAHDAKDIKLGPESERLAKVLAEKTRTLSVRDVLTARTLSSIGIENVVVTGCPSNFLNMDPLLGEKICRKAVGLAEQKIPLSRIRVCISEFSGGHSQSGAVLKEFLEVMANTPAFYVLQSPTLLPFIAGETESLPKGYVSNSPKTQEEIKTLIRAKTLHFSSVDSWLDFARTCSFAFGMRIHGTIVALQAGVPSLMIWHDSRTLGLAKEMGVPAVSPDDFLSLLSGRRADLYSHAAKEMENYDAIRSRLALKMRTYLHENSLAPREELVGLCGK